AAVSLASLVYGLALIYFATGSVSFPSAAAGASNLMLDAGIVLMTAGFAFELALVPLHWGALDAYTAAAPAAAGAVMALSKLGAVIAIVRLAPLGGSSFLFVLGMIGLLTAVWGTVGALAQRELRRLLAYSAIAHAGFLAMAAASGAAGGQAAIFYVVVYGATAMLVFAALAGLGPEPITFSELPARLGVQRSLALCFGLMSLAGIPPLPGFWAKLALFGASWPALGPAPTIIGVAAAVAAAVYYLYPVPDLWSALKVPAPRARGSAGILLASLVVLALTIVPGFLWSMIRLQA
ncbi:MAG TPA: proton-conducting transporter membrane subunit, partial [Chloroflexota bacterium]|nr:proton-conducting transporter membrane subunit [Chloroflexota bacterium]